MFVRVRASCFLKLARTERINNTDAINGLFSLAEQTAFWNVYRSLDWVADESPSTRSHNMYNVLSRDVASFLSKQSFDWFGEPSHFCRTRLSTCLASPRLLVKLSTISFNCILYTL
ncbi:unnamed protein product [Ixodes pacificus]